MRWFGAAIVVVLACSSCGVRPRTASVLPPVLHEVDAENETEDHAPGARTSGSRIADPSERRRFFDARRHTFTVLTAARAELGTPRPDTASTTVNPAQWTFIGPQPIVYGTNNPLAGSVLTLALDPHNPNTIYAGTFVGYLWKTTNGGVTWLPLSDAGPLLGVTVLATDPTLANTVYALSDGSIYKSADGGTSWTEIPVASASASCSGEGFAVHPAVSGTWLVSEYCGSSSGATSVIYKTTNSGAAWTQVATVPGEINVVQFNAGTPAYAYASGMTPGLAAFFQVSTNSGSTWANASGSGASALPQNLLETTANAYAGFASAPSDPKTVYLRVEAFSAPTLLTLYKTTDAGQTWSLTNLTAETPGARTPSLTAVDPNNPSLVYCGSKKLYLSLNGGATWVDERGDLTAGGLHGDNHAMIFSPDGNTAYTSNDGGVWSSTNFRNQAGVVWNNLNSTFGTAEFSNQLGLDPVNPNHTFGGLQDNFTLAYSGTLPWAVATANGDGRGAAVNPQNTQTVYAMGSGTLSRSTKGGAAGTWNDILDNSGRFLIDPSNPQTLYAFDGPPSNFMVSANGGTDWAVFGPSQATAIDEVAIAPPDSHTVLVMDGGQPYLTQNAQAGATAAWSTGLHIADSAQIGGVQAAVIDPVNPNKIYVLYGDNAYGISPLMISADGGFTWQAHSWGSYVMDTPRHLLVDPDLPNVLYMGTESAIFRSSDAGASWFPLASGFPMVQVDDIALQRAARILRVATAGRGAWDLAVPLTAPLPSSATLAGSGSSETLTVNGDNFAATSQIWLNGKALATTYLSAKQLTASVPASSIAPSTVYNVAVNTPGNTGGLSDPVKVSTGPTIYAGGLLNAASPVTVTADLPGNPFDVRVSPGMFASIYGSGLASASALAGAYPYPQTLGNVSVMVNGAPAPVYYVSPQQIDFVMPWNTPSGTATISVTSNGVNSNQVKLQVEPAPQIFTLNQQGYGQAAVLVAGTSIIAAPTGMFPGSRPAAKGEYLSIYATGLGAVANPPSDGAPVSGQSITVVQPTVLIGCLGSAGVLNTCAVTPQFSGLAPGFVGLYQINFQVPQTALSGSNVPLQLQLSSPTGRPSNFVTVAIQ